MVGVQFGAESAAVSDDGGHSAGQPVNGPFAAQEQANVINKHALEATGGKTNAKLAQDDPGRHTSMTASFPRASLFTSVLAFGVSAMAGGLGIVLIIIGVAISFVANEPESDELEAAAI